MSNISDHVFTKMSSGRWLCTMGVVIVFVVGSLTHYIPVPAIVDLSKLVITFYFVKAAMEGNGGKS